MRSRIRSAAQIPCDHCIDYHAQQAKHYGTTDAQIKEALGTAALTRKWSRLLNGSNYDCGKWSMQWSVEKALRLLASKPMFSAEWSKTQAIALRSTARDAGPSMSFKGPFLGN